MSDDFFLFGFFRIFLRLASTIRFTAWLNDRPKTIINLNIKSIRTKEEKNEQTFIVKTKVYTSRIQQKNENLDWVNKCRQ